VNLDYQEGFRSIIYFKAHHALPVEINNPLTPLDLFNYDDGKIKVIIGISIND
jgi:hypothetical protein